MTSAYASAATDTSCSFHSTILCANRRHEDCGRRDGGGGWVTCLRWTSVDCPGPESTGIDGIHVHAGFDTLKS